MPRAEWGADPEFFGPRHAYREALILRQIESGDLGGSLHLECAAGVGSLSIALARRGATVVAADRSLRSLHVVAGRVEGADLRGRVLPVVADATSLPFSTATFKSVTSAETLEHIQDDTAAIGELARVLTAGGRLVGTVPAGPEQWSAWDDWAGHLRRYRRPEVEGLLASAGLAATVSGWGWPLVRLYDALFMKRVNRRRLCTDREVAEDTPLRAISALGRKRWLVRLVRMAFSVERVFPGAGYGVGWLYRASKAAPPPPPGQPDLPPAAVPSGR
ncbi:MAG: methyltransferase domain-containing protein [Acidobacteria bacterium]|nr:methyltransferase domain-containing protein [Acidobacteriota bacterium]